MITFAMKSGRHSGCRCFTCFTSDQASMEPSDGPLAFLVQFAAFNLFFCCFFPGETIFPAGFTMFSLFLTKGKAMVAPEAFMVVGTVGRAARRRDFLGTHVGQNGRIGHFLIGLGKSPQSSDTVSVGSTWTQICSWG